MWCEEIEWGVQADMLIKDIWRFAPDRHREILDLVDMPNYGIVETGLAKGRGALIFYAHVGPLFAGLAWLTHSRFKFKKLAFSGHEAVGSEANRSTIVTGNQRLAPARQIMRALNEGYLVAHTIDTPFGDTVTIEFRSTDKAIPFGSTAWIPRCSDVLGSAAVVRQQNCC
jgi:hypothetical protein